MPKPIAAVASITMNASPAAVFAAVLALDPVTVVKAKGLIPGVKSVSGQTGGWSAAGQTRTLTLSDGAAAQETLIALEPQGYRYRVSGFTGLFSRLVREANARFDVTPRGEGSMLTWAYEFTPKGPLAGVILSFLVDSQWNAYMDAALEHLKGEIERA